MSKEEQRQQRRAKIIAELINAHGPMPIGEGLLITDAKGKWKLIPLPGDLKRPRVDGYEVHYLRYSTTWICPECWNTDGGSIGIYERTAEMECLQCQQIRRCHAIEQQRSAITFS